MLSFDGTEDVTETTSTLAQKTGVSRRTIARDMDALKEKGFVIRVGLAADVAIFSYLSSQ